MMGDVHVRVTPEKKGSRVLAFVAIEPGDLENIGKTGGIFIDFMVGKNQYVPPFFVRSRSPFYEDRPEHKCSKCEKFTLRENAEKPDGPMKCINEECPSKIVLSNE